MNPPPATVEQLVIRLEEAARVLRLVALSRGSRGPAGAASGWPAIVREAVEAYGYQAARAGKVLPTARDIAQMDEVLSWVARYWNPASLEAVGLPRDAGQIAWQRISRVPMPVIVELRWARWGMVPGRIARPPGGMSRPSLLRLADLAVRHMARQLGAMDAGAPLPLPPDRRVMGVVVDFVAEEGVKVDEQGRPTFRTVHARARHDLVKPGRGQG